MMKNVPYIFIIIQDQNITQNNLNCTQIATHNKTLTHYLILS